MKKQLEDDLIVMMAPYLAGISAQDLKIRLQVVLGKYDISEAKHEIVAYEGDINENTLNRFLSAKIAQGCAPRTVLFYKNTLTFVLRIIGKPYMDITADDIRMYVAQRIFRDKISKVTANNERRCLSTFYAWLQREEILLKNPMTKVDAIKVNKKKKKAFDQMDLEKIRAACLTKRESAMVEVMISTWSRVSEVVQIRIDDIHDGKLIVHGKGSKDREVYLTPRAILTVGNYLSERSDSNPYLFPKAKDAGNIKMMCKGPRSEMAAWYKNPANVHESDHMVVSSAESIIRNIGKRAGVPDTHPHRFRRTGATMALRSGMPLIQVSKILGHENVGTTQIYLDISEVELEQAHRKYVN